MSSSNSVHDYLSLVKFSHTVFAMPFALIGLFLGYREIGSFNLFSFVMVLLCMVFARNAAMSFNRLIDRTFDAQNPRTSRREIPNGVIKPKSALVFVIINSLLFISTTFFINRLVFFLSPIALFVVFFYSYTKRFTPLCHIFLGLGLSLAPIGAYLAVTGHFSLLPLMFSVVVLFWSSGFDIIYSLQDEQFDREVSLRSIPEAIGRKNALAIACALHLLVTFALLFVGLYFGMGIFYWVGTLLFVTLLVYQHLIVSPSDISRVNMAFSTTNGLASLVFATFNILEVVF